MIYCSSKNLSRKTLSSYEQALKLFKAYLQSEFAITEVEKIQAGHLRQYIKYLNERGKYTVVNREESKDISRPQNRKDYNKEILTTIIANYVLNIKVFFNYLYHIEKEIKKNPVDSVENPKIERKMKKH